MHQTLTALVSRSIENLKDSREALFYLKKRSVPESLYTLHNVGFYTKLPKVKERTDLHVRWNFWVNHVANYVLVFPLYNFEGKIIGLQTRSIVEKRYDTFIIKEDTPVFFGLPVSLQQSYEKGWTFLTEGVFDYFSVKQVIPNVLSPLTIKISTKHARYLNRFVSAVALGSDNDQKNTTDKQIDETVRTLQEQNLYVKRVVPFYKDWNEYLENNQAQELRRVILEASELMNFTLEDL